MTKIFRCSCKSEYQDGRYGQNQRVFNAGQKANDRIVYRCTVCGAPHETIERKKKKGDE